MKFLKTLKDLFFKIFGKAWWFAIPLCLLSVYLFISLGFSGFLPVLFGIQDEDGNYCREIEIFDNEYFSVNSKGIMVLTGNETSSGVAAVMDIETGEKIYSNINQVTIDASRDGHTLK